ncbi:nuclear transport factor 2 family protein [Flagellimonas hymeniacidonis]|uniref:Nuclear transport factor 2 family protein n=1 Tax=Flagellimonas hymeniacidonis TaxID=2603628 RepID=A0A5C8V712_9FLAO|nr:nuclear transport factor 2 family protein [Flagellimonas hymeniacidonis]TXN37482.1 nuclear transport factor 2 family protein [Flagellimonas hymeniacidonis]
MKGLFYLFFLASFFSFSQSSTTVDDKASILEVLAIQEKAWNNFDIELFMETYWKSDDLIFYGSSGVTKGWQNTLERYKKSYPTKEHFGQLRLTSNEISKINAGVYSVFGEYHLTRTVGDTQGIFMLVLKNIDGAWKIIADTSCKTD